MRPESHSAEGALSGMAPAPTSAPRVRYWIFNYRPEWEGVSKEVASLRQGLGTAIEGSVVSLNTGDRRLRLGGPEKRIPLPLGLPLLPLLRPYASGADINHLFASSGERWLGRMLAGHNPVLTVAKGTESFERIERNVPTLLRYRAIVVQCERDGDLMRQIGVPDRSIRLIRPGLPIAEYREASGPFTILFASSPLAAGEFLTRGLYLMLRVAARLPDVRFLLVWRRSHVAKLRRLIQGAGVSNIEILDGVVRDMAAVYDRVHATILPALEHRSFIPCPRSGLDSMAQGKPLLVSRFVSIAESLAASGAGVAFEPTVAELEEAVLHLRKHYSGFQQRTHPYMREYFSPSAHLELHRRLYQEISP